MSGQTLRDAHAAETRARILAVADVLLLSGGYRSMTIARLAREAGISPQTIYNSVGGKAEVVKAVYDIRLAGDDKPMAMNDRPEIRAVLDAPDAMQSLWLYARNCRMIYQRVGPLLGVLLDHGPGGDELLENFTAATDGERRIGNTVVVTNIEQRFGLPERWTTRRAVDLVWTLTGPEVADRLIRRAGWSLDTYETWLARALQTELAETGRRSKRPR
jgi:AcrR family transcriptional regulator